MSRSAISPIARRLSTAAFTGASKRLGPAGRVPHGEFASGPEPHTGAWGDRLYAVLFPFQRIGHLISGSV